MVQATLRAKVAQAAAKSGLRPLIDSLPGSLIREVANAGIGRSDIIALWFGEPDLPTPAFIREAAKAALDAGHTFYTPNRGIPELRAALSDYMTRLHGTKLGVDRVTITASAMQALMVIAQSVIEPGDNVVLTTPLWPNIAEATHVVGGETRLVPLTMAQDGWHLDTDELLARIDERTRVVFINSPGNPTGWIMPQDQQRAILAECRRRGIWLLADEVYNRIVFDGAVAPSFLSIAEPEDRLFVVNSFSKTWAMTGWRLGWITAPADVGPALEKMNEYSIAGPTSFAQHGGVTAVRDGETFIAESVARYRAARDLVVARLSPLPRIRLASPPATFYAFFAVDGLTDSFAFAKEILGRAGVGLAPGVAFGKVGEGHLRLCFAASKERLNAALDRLVPLLS